jgi:hypothetical protein
LRLLLFGDGFGGGRLFLCCCARRSWRLDGGWFGNRRRRRFSLRAQAHLHENFIKRSTFTLGTGRSATAHQGFWKLSCPTLRSGGRFRRSRRGRNGFGRSRRLSPGPTGNERVDIRALRRGAGPGGPFQKVGRDPGVRRNLV